MKDPMQTPGFKKLLQIGGVLIVILIIFWSGMVVGAHRGEYAGRWNMHYAENFSGMGSPFIPPAGGGMKGRDDMRNSHGAFGEIVAIKLPNIVIKGPAEAEKTIIISNTTMIRNFHDVATSSDLKVGTTVVVIGNPDSSGDIQATLIRMVPPPTGGSVVGGIQQASSTQQK